MKIIFFNDMTFRNLYSDPLFKWYIIINSLFLKLYMIITYFPENMK